MIAGIAALAILAAPLLQREPTPRFRTHVVAFEDTVRFGTPTIVLSLTIVKGGPAVALGHNGMRDTGGVRGRSHDAGEDVGHRALPDADGCATVQARIGH